MWSSTLDQERASSRASFSHGWSRTHTRSHTSFCQYEQHHYELQMVCTVLTDTWKLTVWSTLHTSWHLSVTSRVLLCADGRFEQSQCVCAAAAAGAAHSGFTVWLHAGGEGRLFQSTQERAGCLQCILQVTHTTVIWCEIQWCVVWRSVVNDLLSGLCSRTLQHRRMMFSIWASRMWAASVRFWITCTPHTWSSTKTMFTHWWRSHTSCRSHNTK